MIRTPVPQKWEMEGIDDSAFVDFVAPGTFSTKLAFRIGVPGLVIFWGLGMLFGSNGLNLIIF
ncbi:hypothetical protein MTHERMOG20_16320 [Moorella thermoacetica]|uniref:Potassium/proton antiporter n=1 Tax=Neomoorella thermoacetica TaxID=1525 RepID=A0A1J5NN30_NEOTH|nr:hypothetical protein [Moorella thermoacetica]AKX95132.1 potassium/proton antiporter [Moorella thermoacetica]AKX97757.1 potassium/proton antiporter [Moorella thermoacetica]OIQ09937.1 potassium/proton antiporter [Moorella thermoacetica]OIQ10675.1 potassium/proton antiporter [Moorella thermoacetica]OIQ56588.1 potassium/proton antiporter [Moorella thermoacetica]